MIKKKMCELSTCKICGNESSHSICENCFISFFSNSPDRVSFAFESKIPNFSQLHHVKVLDLFRTSVATINMNDFQELIMLRASHCFNLTKVNLTNVPSLIVLDLSANKELTSFTADECISKIIALDLSYCENLTIMPKTKYDSLQYLSIRHTKISKLINCPKARFLDISSTHITNLSYVQQMKNLEIIILDHMLKIEKIDMSLFTDLPNLNTIQSDIKNITFSKWNEDTKLSQIWLQKSKNVLNINDILLQKEKDHHDKIDFSAYLPNNLLLGNKFKRRITTELPITWHDSYRLLYGPWPPPPCYQKPARRINSPYQLPSEYPLKKVIASISGSIFGAAITDTLFLFVERQSIESLHFFIKGPIDITWSHPIMTRRGIEHYRGGITDNTAYLLLAIRTLTSKDSLHVCSDFAKKLKDFLSQGLPEFQLSIQNSSHPPSILKIARDPIFTTDPTSAAKKYWRTVGETSSGNDALTRAVVAGCYLFWDEVKVADNAQKLCRITHYDPRCAFAAVSIALTISRLIKWRCGLMDQIDIEKVIDDSAAYVKDLTPYMAQEAKTFANVDSLDRLNLKNFAPLALQAVGCAFWALKKNLRYVEAMEAIITAGGDAATNCVITGAVIGAKYGLGGIPIDLMQFFWKGAGVYRDMVSLFKSMNIDFTMPQYDEYFTMKFD